MYRTFSTKKSIAAKLLATVFLFYLIVTAVLTATQMVSQYYNVENAIKEQLLIFERTFEDNLAQTLWELDNLELKSIIDGMVELQDIIGVKIEDHNGKNIFSISGIVINQKGEYVSANEQEKKILTEGIFSELFWHEFPAEYTHESGTTKVGEVTIYSSSSIVFQKVKFGFIFLVVNAILKTLALWLIFIWVSRFLLNRPLSIITSTIKQLDLDNIETIKIDLNSSDENEFHTIEDAFNRMIKKLTLNKRELEELTFSLNQYGEHLEKVVNERTMELSESNSQLKLEIKERKAAEESLLASEEEYKSTLNNLPVGVVVHAADTSILLNNQEAENILGLTYDQMSGKTAIDPSWDFIHEDSNIIKVEDYPVSKVLSTKMPLFDYIMGINRPDRDHVTWVIVNAIPVFSKENELEKIIVNFANITDLKQLEERYRQAQKLESIGTLAGGIAHDFNNILFPIIGNTEMILEDIPEDSPLRDNLNEIFTGAMRAGDLVKQILAFSRQDSHEIKLMKMQPVIKEALKLIRSTIPTSIEIKQTISKDCGIIKADPTQIHQVVMNLSTNAYHAMEDTGGELRVNLKEVELSEQDLTSTDMGPGKYACLTIADTGYGIDANIKDRIFDPYFTTKEQGKGTGMGLAVTHGIVKNTGGTIQMHSEPGQGTEFHIYLPIEQSSYEQMETQTKEPILHGTEQILLVDDEEAIVFMEKQMLERLGYSVVSRTSSVEALEAFKANPNKFDVVITDMAMPNMSGKKLAVELLKIRSNIPILLCTGFSEKIPDEKAKSMGIKGFLMKPIIRRDLSNMLREVLDATEMYEEE